VPPLCVSHSAICSLLAPLAGLDPGQLIHRDNPDWDDLYDQLI